MKRGALALFLVACGGAVEPSQATTEPPTIYSRTTHAERGAGGWALAVARCELDDELVAGTCEHPRIRLSQPADIIEGFGPGWACGSYAPISATVTCQANATTPERL